MKNTLLILCALVCGTLAFAQTAGTYTDNLHVIVNGDDEGVKQGNVTIAYQDDEKSIIDFTLHDFSVDISMSGTLMSINLGDVTVKDIELGDEVDGVASFSCTDDHNVEYPDIDSNYASLVSDVSITMTGDVSETKLHANMEITVKVLAGLLSYPITATFGYGYDDYLIVNVKTGNYLAGGLDYGTHAMEGGKPQFFSLEEQTDGTYTLDSHQTNGGDSHYLSDGLYVDAAATNWTLEAVDGGYTISCTAGYLTGNGFQKELTLASTAGETAVWKLVTKDEVIAGMDEATISDPVDVTPLIPSCEPKRNAWGDVVSTGVWTVTGYNEEAVPANYAFGADWQTASCAESYHSTNGFDIRQTFSLPKAGYYELTAQAFYRNDGGSVIPSLYVTTGTSATNTNGNFENVHLPEHNTTSDGMTTAYPEFLDGDYPVSLPFIVDNEGDEFTVGFESNVDADDVMWTIFGELGLLYMGTELPTLTAVEGKMNVDVQAAMEAAIATYNSAKTSANFLAAEQAILDAEESVAYYAEIAAALASGDYKNVLETFDDAGQAAFENDFMAAYTACTLTNETLEEGLAAACKAQTTAGSDMSYAMENSGEWTAQSNNGLEYPISADLTITASYNGEGWSTGDVLWKTISGLQAGTYTVTFYGAANYANTSNTGTFLAGGATAFANDANESIDINYRSGGSYNGALLDDEYHSFTNVTVGDDGVLTFGMSANTTGQTGNWYLAKAVSLTLGEVEEEEDPYIYDITSLLANPSFEEDAPTGDFTDTTRGAYTATSLTGWTLAAPTGGYAISDLMTKDATATDNDFGVPGSPSDENYMLYLRNSHLTYSGTGTSASVMQDVTLPAGNYKLAVDSKCVASGSAGTVSLVAGEDSKSITIHVKTSSNATDPFLDAWDTATLTFSLTETTEVTLGVSIAYDTSNDVALSVLLDNFQLFSTEEVETVEYKYDVTWELANPSFEVDNVVADLSEDETRENTEKVGAWTVTSLTGWDLTAPTTGYAVSDLMTKDAKETDNDFGVPGEPSDGTYMLYLRDAHAEQNENHLDDASVMQTISLPAGDYKLTVDSKCVATSTAAGKVTLVADEHSKALTIHVTENGSDDTKENPFLASWDNASLSFSLDTEAEVTVGVNIEFTDGSTNYPLSVLLDNFKLYSVEEIEKEISWTMTDAGWGTMILPFSATLEDGLTAYSCDGTTTDEETETTTVNLAEVGQSITANTPYIIKCTDDSAIKAHSFTGTPTNTVETYTDGILTGTLVDLAVAKGAAFATDGTMYLLQNHVDENGEEVDDGLAFYPIIAATEDAENSSEATLDAYHCYLDLSLVTTSARPVALHFPGAGEETGIVAVEGAEAEVNGAIYDLSGRRVAKAVKGVYIQNGKKVLVK